MASQEAQVQEVREARCEDFLGKMYRAVEAELRLTGGDVKVYSDVFGDGTIELTNTNVSVTLSCIDDGPRFTATARAYAYDKFDVLEVSAEGGDPEAALRELKKKAADAIVEYAKALLSLAKAMAREALRAKDPLKATAALKASQVYVWHVMTNLEALARALDLDVAGVTYKLDRVMKELEGVDDKVYRFLMEPKEG